MNMTKQEKLQKQISDLQKELQDLENSDFFPNLTDKKFKELKAKQNNLLKPWQTKETIAVVFEVTHKFNPDRGYDTRDPADITDFRTIDCKVLSSTNKELSKFLMTEIEDLEDPEEIFPISQKDFAAYAKRHEQIMQSFKNEVTDKDKASGNDYSRLFDEVYNFENLKEMRNGQ
jgi:hypothetical protein